MGRDARALCYFCNWIAALNDLPHGLLLEFSSLVSSRFESWWAHHLLYDYHSTYVASGTIPTDVPKFALVLVASVLFTRDEVDQRLNLITVIGVIEAETNQKIY